MIGKDIVSGEDAHFNDHASEPMDNGEVEPEELHVPLLCHVCWQVVAVKELFHDIEISYPSELPSKQMWAGFFHCPEARLCLTHVTMVSFFVRGRFA